MKKRKRILNLLHEKKRIEDSLYKKGSAKVEPYLYVYFNVFELWVYKYQIEHPY